LIDMSESETSGNARRITIRLLALAVLVASCSIWWAWARDMFEDPVGRGLEAFERGRPAEALRWANEALERSPNDARARVLKERAEARLARPRSDAQAQRPALSPVALHKQAARAHLAAGRPQEARDELTAVLAEGPDPEASWLLSRALLQESDIPGATAAFEQASTFGDDDPTTPEPAPYVGSANCVPCHKDQARTQRTSRHARTILTGSALANLPLPQRSLPDPGDPRVAHVFQRQGETLRVETRLDDQVRRALIEFAIGSGDRGASFIGRDEQNQTRLIRMSTFDHYKTFDLVPQAPARADRPDDYLGRRMGDALPGCLGCHTTRLDRSNDGGLVPFDGGIRCERCHGPGGNHLRAVGRHFADLAIARPKLATAAQLLKLCGQCHQPPAGVTLGPDDPTRVRQQAQGIAQSRCSTKSAGAFRCTTCHDPHRDAETDAGFYETKCLECHTSSRAVAKSQTMRSVVCRVNPSGDCLRCHMPKVENPTEHAWFTDHHIRIHR
jgi:hypothetical protein